MNWLYISKYPIHDHTPKNNRIGTIESKRHSLWTCGIIPPERFIIDTYNINTFVFFIDYIDILCLEDWDLAGEKIDIVVRQCDTEDRKIDALYYIGTDYNLNINVFFHESMEEYFKILI